MQGTGVFNISAPVILRLTIERFRGIKYLQWHPVAGMNVILGGGDVGKTTILDAIALLLNPTNSTVLSDADYWQRDVEKGFSIEGVMSLPDLSGVNKQARHIWPWHWDGREPQLPKVDEEPGPTITQFPVYRLRVRGTSDFDLIFEVLQPDGDTDHFSVILRRNIGLVRLSGDDRNDRDLRLVQGSALERLVSDKTLRSRLGGKLAQDKIETGLKAEAQSRLLELDETFKDHALPAGLGLGLTGGQGLSLNALIGLTASKDSVQLPLASWGAGTRRWAALLIAAAHHGETPITLVDEVERGLEPYRQRILISELQNGGSQVFATTHSSAALSASFKSALWYVDVNGQIGRLPAAVSAHLQLDPETFLARLAVIAEGRTEVGLIDSLLRRAIGDDLLAHGIWITDGRGNDQTLTLLEATECGVKFAGFADNEKRNPQRWAEVQKRLGNLVFRWPDGCVESNIIKLVPMNRLEEFIRDSDGESGARLRTLADRLGIEKEKSFETIAAKTSNLTKLIIEAATGVTPDDKKDAPKEERRAFKKHGEVWFKSVEGGRELADKVFRFGLWPGLKEELMPFINAVRRAVFLPETTDIPS